MSIKTFLGHPLTVLGFMGLGILFGLVFPSFCDSLGDFGQVYLRVLQMCVLPLVASAVFNSIVGLCTNRENASGLLKALIAFFTLGMVLEIVIGVSLTSITSMGHEIDVKSLQVLGSFISSEGHGGDVMVFKGWMDFFHMIIPHNPFTAFADGSGLKILFFSIVMGVAFSAGKREQVKVITDILSEIFEACIRVLNFLTLLLPFGLFFIFAKQFSTITMDVLLALGKLLVFTTVTCLVMMLANLIVLKISSQKTFLATLKDMTGILVMAFGTSSGFVTMPRMMRDMESSFKVEPRILNLIIPLAVNMSPQGTCLCLAIFSTFFCQMYHIALDPGIIMVMGVGTIMISLAISGLPAIVGISMISAMLESLGVPAGISSVILMAVFPFIDPFLTMLNCIGSCTYAMLLNSQSVTQPSTARAAVASV